jgi:hypothetical protein
MIIHFSMRGVKRDLSYFDHDMQFAGQWYEFPDILTNYQQTHVELMDRQRPD